MPLFESIYNVSGMLTCFFSILFFCPSVSPLLSFVSCPLWHGLPTLSSHYHSLFLVSFDCFSLLLSPFLSPFLFLNLHTLVLCFLYHWIAFLYYYYFFCLLFFSPFLSPFLFLNLHTIALFFLCHFIAFLYYYYYLNCSFSLFLLHSSS